MKTTLSVHRNPGEGRNADPNRNIAAAATSAQERTRAKGLAGRWLTLLTIVALAWLGGAVESSGAVIIFGSVPVANSQFVLVQQSTAKSITLTAFAAPGTPLVYTVTSAPAHGTLSGTAPNLTYTPNASYSGLDSFQFKVNDGVVESVAATISIVVLDGEPCASTAIYDSAGFESPHFAPGSLAGQDAANGPWLRDGAGPGDAIIQGTNVADGAQAVRIDRAGADLRFAVSRTIPNVGSSLAPFVLVDWSMNYTPAGLPSGSFGPCQGIEVYDDNGASPLLAASAGVDATTGELLFQAPMTGFFSAVPGIAVSANAWHTYRLELNYAAQTYRLFFDGAAVLTNSFVDAGIADFTDASIMTVAAAGDATSQAAAGTAYFDNYRVGSASTNLCATNHCPIVTNLVISVASGSSLSRSLTATDSDEDTLIFSPTDLPDHGLLTLNAAGGLTYTPDAGYCGPDSVLFNVNDGHCSSPGTVSITVTCPPTLAGCPTNLSSAVLNGTDTVLVDYALSAAGFPTPTVTCVPASGSAFAVGTTLVTCAATNDVGTNACTFTVTVCAANITVTTTNDVIDGSLRWAIANLCPGGTIMFDPALNRQSIALTNAQLFISKSLTILGPGPEQLAVIADPIFFRNVFKVTSGVVYISGLTVRDGAGTEGGGIFNSASLTLSNVVVTSCFSFHGGGLYNTGDLTLLRCTVSENFAEDGGGGGLVNFGTLVMSDCTVGPLNYAGFDSRFGGGILNRAGALFMTNSTVSGNSAQFGGGIFMLAGSATLMHSTIASNFAFRAAGGYGQNPSVAGTFGHTLIASNSSPAAPDFGTHSGITLMDGVITSLGHNLVGITNGTSGWLVTDLTGSSAMPLDPVLGPLADNGGPTLTHALLYGSPAVNRGIPAISGAPAFDQRGPGFPRVLGRGIVDIGAYEMCFSIGDFTGDGITFLDDFAILRSNFGTAGSDRFHGDLDGDTDVDAIDFLMLRSNFGEANTNCRGPFVPPSGLPVGTLCLRFHYGGHTELFNSGGSPISFSAYSIYSAASSLDSNTWTSISEQPDAVVTAALGAGATEFFLPNQTLYLLSELNLSSAGTLAAGGAFGLGMPYSGNPSNVPTDVRFFYTEAGVVKEGCVFEAQAVAPLITCPTNPSAIVPGNTYTAVVEFAPSATGFPDPSITCAPSSGSAFAVGSTLVTCTATNLAGTNTCAFTVTVVALDSNAPAILSATGGSTLDTINLAFNEPLDSTTAQNASFYNVVACESVVRSLRFTTANDAPERDPMTFTLEGTLGDPLTGPWTLMASGDTGLLPLGRNMTGADFVFPNTRSYRSYRLLFPTIRNAAGANSMQIAEVEFLDANTNQVTSPTDAVVGVRAVAGNNNSEPAVPGFSANQNNYPFTEPPSLAIDRDKTGPSKYLNFAKLNTGLIVTPAGSSTALPVRSVVLSPDGRSVTLTTDPQVPQALYCVTVQGVRDLAANPIAPPGDQISFRAQESGPACLVNWKFDEASGPTALDSAGNSILGRLTNGPVRTNGILGRALWFDGSNDRVQATNATSLNVTGAFTVACWVRPESLKDYRYFLIKGNDANERLAYALRSYNARVEYRWVSPAGVQSAFRTTTNVLATGRWTHVAAAHAPGSAPIIFINGVAVPASIIEGSATHLIGTSPNPFCVGASADNVDKFKGTIDEVFVCLTKLTAGQIRNLTNGLPPGPPPPPPAVGIATASPLPGGVVDAAYSTTLFATGGTPGFTWSLVSGTLPGGLTLNTNTGVISGTAATPGTNTFRVRVLDNAGQTAEKEFTVGIATRLPCLVHWKFDEINGSTALDSSGNGINGTLVNDPSRTNGWVNRALRFDGSNDRVNGGNPSSLNHTGALTLAAWVRPESVSGTRLASIKGELTDKAYAWALGQVDGKLQYRWVNTGGNAAIYQSTPVVLTSGRWTHIAAVHTPGSAPRLYTNGVLVAGTLTSGSATANVGTTSKAFTVGSSSDGGNRFQGIIDEVFVCRGALSTASLSNLMAGLPPDFVPAAPAAPSPLPSNDLAIACALRVLDGVVILSWPSTPGFSYHVQFKNALESDWQEMPGEVYATGTEVSVEEALEDHPQRFYRLVVGPRP